MPSPIGNLLSRYPFIRDLEGVIKQVVISLPLILPEDPTEKVPLKSIENRWLKRAVRKYIKKGFSDAVFEEIFANIGRTDVNYAAEFDWKFFGLGPRPALDTAQQKEALARLRFGIIAEIELKWQKDIYLILSEMKLREKESSYKLPTYLQDAKKVLVLPNYLVAFFTKHMTPDGRYYVRSEAARSLAEFLCHEDIPYEYRSYWFTYKDSQGRDLHIVPDFYLPRLNTCVEYFGTYVAEYKEKAEERMRIYRQIGIRFMASDNLGFLKRQILAELRPPNFYSEEDREGIFNDEINDNFDEDEYRFDDGDDFDDDDEDA